MKFEQVFPALAAGKRVRRPNFPDGTSLLDVSWVSMKDIMADDWEIEPETRELSRADIERAWARVVGPTAPGNARTLCVDVALKHLLSALGFTEEK